MDKRTMTLRLVCIAVLLVFIAPPLRAQEDHYIENQRYVVGIADFQWGNTYVGTLGTSGNALILTNYIHGGTTSPVTLQVSSLQIGLANNYSNTVEIYKGGTLEIEGAFTVLGTNNGNGLLIDDQGTLFVKTNFDAAMGGFDYNAGANLKVGGEVSHLDNVEGGLNFTLTGENASWNFRTNILKVGATTDANSVTIEKNAQIEIGNLAIGSAGTAGNSFIITDGGRAHVLDSLNILGSGNFLRVTNNGWLEVDMDFDAETPGFELQTGGGLEAHRNLTMDAISDGVKVVLDGTNALWNRSGLSMDIGSSTSDNQLTITNNGTVRASRILIGATNNAVLITDGGNLVLDGAGSYINANSSLTITHGGRLTVESNFWDAIDWHEDASFYWGNGGILECQGTAPIFDGYIVNGQYIEIGTLFLRDGQILILNGSNAAWNAAGHNLHVGDLSSGNALIVTNGGYAEVKSMTIGDFAEGGNNNRVLITGAGSEIYSIGDVEIGGRYLSGAWQDGGTNNFLEVADGGKAVCGATLRNQNGSGASGIRIGTGATVAANDYYQASGALLMYELTATPANLGALQITNTATFETGAKLGFYTQVSGLALDAYYTNTIVSAGTLVVGGTTNAVKEDMAGIDLISGSLVDVLLFVEDQDIVAILNRVALSQGAGFAPGSMMSEIANEIDSLSTNGNAAAANQINVLNGMTGSEQSRQLNQLYAYQLPTYMHNQGLFGGIEQVRARGASFHNTWELMTPPDPKSAASQLQSRKWNQSAASRKSSSKPELQQVTNQALQGWVKVYGGYGTEDSDYEDGYDLQSGGTVIGFDKSFGPLLLGAAGGSAGSQLEGDNGDQSDATTGYGVLYASYGSGTEAWFGDIVASYGLSDIDNDSGTAFDVTSSTKARQTALYVGGGREFREKESNVLIHLLTGLQVSLYDQDAYTEESPNAVAKDVAAYARLSYQSTLGAVFIVPSKAASGFDLETRLRAYWLHEFNDDEEKVDYMLVGSAQPGQFVLRAPDQDVAQLGIGWAAKWENGIGLQLDLDSQIGSTALFTAISGALLYEF